MRAIFIAGTDTGVGKTLVTGLLAEYLKDKGKSVATQKWVTTGKRGQTPIPRYRRAGSDPLYSFRFPASPHLAARLEKKVIDKRKIKKSFRSLSRQHDFVVVEGTGGILVPIGGKKLLIDIVKELNIPVLLVVGNRLGAINHTLLTIEALRRRKISIVGIIFNNISEEKKIILEDNQRMVKKLSRVGVLGALPKSCNMNILKKRFKTIGDKIDFYGIGQKRFKV